MALHTIHRLPTELPVREISGEPHQIGHGYGRRNMEPIIGFFHHQIKPSIKHREFARACWPEIEAYSDNVSQFVRGMADGAGIELEEAVLLTLHEELGHMHHCTAFGATDAATKGGETLIGQNWDWTPTLYGRSQLWRLSMPGLPRMLCYGYPGLWASAGINEAGLALVWTSSGVFPKVEPLPGVPTYAVIAEVLAQTSVAGAVAALERARNAGCFIFFLADAEGALCVAEGWPLHKTYDYSSTAIARANHYECAAAVAASGQQVESKAKWRNDTAVRARAMREALERLQGRIDEEAAMDLLRIHNTGRAMSICRHPGAKRGCHTLDSLIANCTRRDLLIARGYPCRHEFQRISV